MTTILKYVGNFAELGYDDHPAPPSLIEGRGKRGDAHKQQVVAYLRSGATLVYSPGFKDDVLDRTRIAGSASVATDGVYVWPATLAYYVETYDVELPREFELHMQHNAWTVPSAIATATLELPRYST